MKTNLLASAAAFILFAGSASADVIIESKVESPQLNTTATSKIKGGKVRTDFTGLVGAMSSIKDTSTGYTAQLMHGSKIAMKTTAEQMKQAIEMEKKKGIATAGKPTKPVATGQKEKVGEYECEIYTWKGGVRENRYWIALNHPQAKLLKESEKTFNETPLGNFVSGPDMSELPGPILKTEMTAKDGMTSEIIKVTTTILSIKEANVDPSEFDIPKDYRDISDLGGTGVPAAK